MAGAPSNAKERRPSSGRRRCSVCVRACVDRGCRQPRGQLASTICCARVFWIVLFLYGELFAFYSAVYSCSWPVRGGRALARAVRRVWYGCSFFLTNPPCGWWWLVATVHCS